MIIIEFILVLVICLIAIVFTNMREDEELFNETYDNGNDNDEYYIGSDIND